MLTLQHPEDWRERDDIDPDSNIAGGSLKVRRFERSNYSLPDFAY
jgi:hypothetical protein